jgi:hypothetical protein
VPGCSERDFPDFEKVDIQVVLDSYAAELTEVNLEQLTAL